VVTHEGPVFRVERLTFAAAEGDTPRVKDVVRHPGAVTVIAVRDDGRLVLVRNRRVAVDRWLLEFCAGKLERGEDPAAAAGRELEEETGYSASRIEPLGAFFTSPGFTDEVMHVFLATGLRPVPQRLEPGEEIEVIELGEDSLRSAVASGGILDGKTLGAYLLWSMKRSIGGHAVASGVGGGTA
jgi:ADP-ribose pyrophosphatase